MGIGCSDVKNEDRNNGKSPLELQRAPLKPLPPMQNESRLLRRRTMSQTMMANLEVQDYYSFDDKDKGKDEGCKKFDESPPPAGIKGQQQK